ncbi:MAG: proline dehydrogenase family protein [Gemmatimonadetes bacterium]|nr:proline dehydrogenase family protein [Gemmatimonadota bacterium]
MSVGRSILLAASKNAFLNEHATRTAFVRRAVRKFMPGERAEDALAAAQAFAPEGRGVIFTQLGENLTRLAEADAVRDHYLGLFDQIKARGLMEAHVSVKPTQLGLDLDAKACAAHLETLAQKAASTGSFLWIDMEDSSYVDRTLALYTTLKARYANTGLAIQAYLKRTPDDLKALWAVKPVIRLVKGAYAEPAHVAFPDKRDTDLAYYELGIQMLEKAKTGDCTAIFGTHDLGLVDRLVEKARALGVSDGAYQVHMLYGIRDEAQRKYAREGRHVKTLVSYGQSWFKWYMRRLAERPANVWFVVRSMFPA